MKIGWILQSLFVKNFDAKFLEYLRSLSEEELETVEKEYEKSFNFVIKVKEMWRWVTDKNYRRTLKAVKTYNKHLENVAVEIPNVMKDEDENEKGEKKDRPIAW